MRNSSKALSNLTSKDEGENKITFSPPDKLAIFFQLFFGGLTLKTTPSEKGSRESTSSSSASPPRVIICKEKKVHCSFAAACNSGMCFTMKFDMNKYMDKQLKIKNSFQNIKTWYISFNFRDIMLNPVINSSSLWKKIQQHVLIYSLIEECSPNLQKH